MASAREADTATWLQNKLGSTDDLWSGNSISSQLSQDRLVSIQECFHTLQPHVKVKLMLSFLHIPKRNIEEWKVEIDEILALAQEDTDQWVSMIGDILKGYTTSGSLNTDIDESNAYFHEVINELKKLVKKSTEPCPLLPLECQFLARAAMLAVAGSKVNQIKHFTLKRKPKSAALRADILQKSADVANKTTCGGTVPFKMRSFAKTLDESGPMRGIASPVTSGFRERNSNPFNKYATSNSVSGRAGPKKDCGIKLLEINEVPVTGKEARRRKRQQENEEMEEAKKKKAADAAAALAAAAEAKANAAAKSNATVVPPQPSVSGLSPQKLTANFALNKDGVQQNNNGANVAVDGNSGQKITVTLTPQQQKSLNIPQGAKLAIVRGSSGQMMLQGATPKLGQHMAIRLSGQQPVQLRQPQPATLLQSQGQLAAQLVQGNPSQLPPAANSAAVVVQGQVTQNQPMHSGQGDSTQATQRLKLTREQMQQAQELFRMSNKVTRPEKALILGFMAGNRENPCPKQGDIVNVLLSQQTESVRQANGSFSPMIVEIYFQMNYADGTYNTITKSRPSEVQE